MSNTHYGIQNEDGYQLEIFAASPNAKFVISTPTAPGNRMFIPNDQAPALALAILAAAGHIKPAGVVAEDDKMGHRRQTIDGKDFSANPDPQFWVTTATQNEERFIYTAQQLVNSTAVRDYFTNETARAADKAEQELTRRRDDLARKHGVGGGSYDTTAAGAQTLIDAIIATQDELAEAKK